MIFHFRLFPGKINDKFFSKIQKTPFLAYFLPIYNCAKLKEKQTNERISSNTGSRRTHGRTNMNLKDPSG